MPLTLTSSHTHPSMQVGYKDPKDDLHSYWGKKKDYKWDKLGVHCMPSHDKAPNNTFVPCGSFAPVCPASTLPHCWLMSQSSPSYRDTRKAQMSRAMDVMFYSLLQQTPKHQTCPLAMNRTQPKASLPHLPLANDPTLVKQRSM